MGYVPQRPGLIDRMAGDRLVLELGLEQAPGLAVAHDQKICFLAVLCSHLHQVEVTDPNAPKVEKSGKEIVDAVCSACHATGALNAPKIGDKAAWAPHFGAGLDHLTQNAIKGVRQMPPRGGSPDLTDIEIARAVAYMANQSGANFKEPAATTAPAKADAKGKGK